MPSGTAAAGVTEGVKERARKRIVALSDDLLDLSHRIHAEPELGFLEARAASRITDALEAGGMRVERAAYGLETAFRASAGTAGPEIAIVAEYDALPVVGHACGHNIIAAAAVGAGLALSEVAEERGFIVRVIGTPGEETLNPGGKVLLLERGAFDGLTAAMMVHPAPFDVLAPVMIAAAAFDVEYTGRGSHAAFYPELGINAADAMTVAQVAMGLLRQHIRATDRMHGIVTHGGDAANIVPARTTGRFVVRSTSLDEIVALWDRIRHCFEAGALATGATLSVVGGKPYAQVRHNAALAQLYRRNAERLGRRFADGEATTRPSGSTDMGNVSLAVPSIHPFVGIGSWPAVNHQPEFTAHCATREADQAVIDGATALAWTAIDLAAMSDPVAYLASEGARGTH